MVIEVVLVPAFEVFIGGWVDFARVQKLILVKGVLIFFFSVLFLIVLWWHYCAVVVFIRIPVVSSVLSLSFVVVNVAPLVAVVILLFIVLFTVIVSLLVLWVLRALYALLAWTAVKFLWIRIIILRAVCASLVFSHVAKSQLFAVTVLFVPSALRTLNLWFLLNVRRVFSTLHSRLLLFIHAFLLFVHLFSGIHLHKWISSQKQTVIWLFEPAQVFKLLLLRR